MARRFDQVYRVKPRDNLGDPDYWNRRFDDIDRRVSSNEDELDSIDGLTAYIEGLALNRLDLVLAPALDKIALVSEQGFLLAHSNSEITLDVNTTQVFAIPDLAERELFAPSPFVTIARRGSQTDYAFAQVMSWDRDAGQLTLRPRAIFGNPGPFIDWEIYTGTAIQQAVLDTLAKCEAARDLALQYKASTAADAAATAADRTTVSLMKNDTLAARDTAQAYAAAAQSWDPSLYYSKVTVDATFVAFGKAQGISAAQQDQARKNIGIFQTQPIATNANWNTLTTPGSFYTESPTGVTNAPVAGAYWYLTVESYGNNPAHYCVQRAIQLDTNTAVNMYIRVFANDIWTPWRKVMLGVNNLSDVDNAAQARSNIGAQANLGYTPANKAGDTFTGTVTTNVNLIAGGNVWSYGGVVYLNSGSTGYLQYQGGMSYYLGSAGYIWHSGNINPVISMRAVYAGDWSPGWGGALDEPFTGAAVVTGVVANSGYIAGRYRYLQYQTASGGWYNFNVV
ncbi:pyocin knob domain-containing protein [Bradyrhizobium pachyrhizi]|uniref:pyocin knob domain-containing protein n=1 Tax=Bradyrhizobium pachyrhizi TaxID=280333 RepID=UPI0024B0B1F0|nr:pyocin knob domain-containing protein [Bradyrhizobium pachyrhizi]WFU52319.1 pyocin knob domain-containing protein [Bradyrhizobium pachyrhizi]